MPRPPGTRNQDFANKKHALVEKLTEYLLSDNVELPSFRQMAIAAETSEPTLRHYFGDRSGVIATVMAHAGQLAEPMRAIVRQPAASIEEAIQTFHQLIIQFRESSRFIAGHAFGLRESMSDPLARKAYLQYIVEPNIDCVAERLVKSRGGPTNFQTARSLAMMLMSSSMFMVMHQNLLDGVEHKPINVSRQFDLIQAWLIDGVARNPEALARENA